jgi:hypothetical protein
MAAKAALIELLASTRVSPTTGLVWEGAIVGFFEPGTATGKAVWLDRDKTLPTGAGQETGTLAADGSFTGYADGIYDIKIYNADDTGLTTPIKTYSSVNIQDSQVGATLTDPDFLDGVDASKVASWDMSLISSGQTRTITIPDADTTLLGTDEVAVFQNKLFEDATCKWVDNNDNTKAVNYEISGATSGKTATLDFNHTTDITITFPAATATLATVSDLFPSGGIIVWSGAVSAIPSGWQICDGTSGTPNLTDRFVIHADADAAGTRNVGDTGGAHTHTLTLNEMPAHTHTYNEVLAAGGGLNGAGGSDGPWPSNTGSQGGGSPHNNMPKYYALAYIMKL